MSVYEKGLELLRKGQSFAMAEIIEQKGSTPRGKGARMLTLADGSLIDTIGGGQLENEAARQAAALLAGGIPGGVYTFDMTSSDVAGPEMICGGQGTVLSTVFGPAEEEILDKACQAVDQRRQGCWLVTLFAGGQVLHAFVDEKKELSCSQALSEKQEKLILDAAGASMHSQESPGVVLCARRLSPNGRLLIFGGGHVGAETAALCQRVGFDVTVIDDRAEFLTPERFPGAATLTAALPGELAVELEPDEDTWILIVSRGHLLDRQWLKWALEARTRPAYIGMIGSKRKREMIYQRLRDEGISQEKIDAVYSPVGLAIGAETPAELAVAIAGEIIQLRALRRGGAKSGACPA